MDPSVHESNRVFFGNGGGRRIVVDSHARRCYRFSIDAGRPAGVALARALQVPKQGIWVGVLNGETSWVVVRLPSTSEIRG